MTSERFCYTFGHSSRTFDEFLQVLHAHGIDCCVDVRSSPYSQFDPQYNREMVKTDIV